ncbi:MAG: DUF2334 domain-containing protein [Clostridium sp.]
MLNKTIVKKWLKYFVITMAVIIALICIKIIIFRTHAITDIQVNKGRITSYNPIKRQEPKMFSDIRAKEMDISKVDIKLYYEGRVIPVKVYEKALRYYVEFETFISEIRGNITKHGDDYVVNYNKNQVKVNKKNESYIKGNKTIDYRGETLVIDGREYISLNDIESMLSLRDTWSTKDSTIHMYNERKSVNSIKPDTTGKAAMIRLEDVSSGGALSKSIAKEKMKIIADNLYTGGMKFHVGWVPRFVNPKMNIDNDLLANKTMDNVQFINMLDYFIQRGGVIGLHGYTHQSANEVSLQGFELTRKLNSSEDETRNIIEKSIEVAKTLNIPIEFFESPHYGATRKQQRIIEEYFNVLYEPYAGWFNLNLNPIYSFSNDKKIYVPAPMGYIHDKHGEKIVKKIEKSKGYYLTSFFIHGSKEMPFINIKKVDKNGYVDYEYIGDSPLTNIVKALKKTGHTTIKVNEL